MGGATIYDVTLPFYGLIDIFFGPTEIIRKKTSRINAGTTSETGR